MSLTSTGNLNLVGGATIGNGMNFGSVAAAGPTDLSKHIALWGTGIGLSVTGGRLNYVVASGNAHFFNIGGTDIAYFNGAGLVTNPGCMINTVNGDTAAGNTIAQLAFTYSGGGYTHWLATRHNASASPVYGNAIDFYVGDGTAGSVFPTNGLWGASVTRFGVSIPAGSFTNPSLNFGNNQIGGASGAGTNLGLYKYGTIGVGVAGVLNAAAGVFETKIALAANSIDLNTGSVFTKTITAATTFTVANVPAAGTTASFLLDLTNGGAFTITWWANMRWAGGTAPSLTASGRDVLGFYTTDGGANWNGLMMGKGMA
jgi:hypothetical protein